jgi:hypothetical protein
VGILDFLTGTSNNNDDIDEQLEWDRREVQSQIEYTNAWLNTGGYDEYDVFDECQSHPKKEVWWKIW